MPPSKSNHPVAILRKAIKLTQRELAYNVSCKETTIKAIEIGKLELSDRLAERLANFFQVPLSRLKPYVFDRRIEDEEWL